MSAKDRVLLERGAAPRARRRAARRRGGRRARGRHRRQALGRRRPTRRCAARWPSAATRAAVRVADRPGRVPRRRGDGPAAAASTAARRSRRSRRRARTSAGSAGARRWSPTSRRCAHLALIARHGAGVVPRARHAEPPRAPRSSRSAAPSRARASTRSRLGTPSCGVLDAPAGPRPLRAVLVGGYYGAWLTPRHRARPALDDALAARAGRALGAGVVVALPADACPVAEVARVVRWMAGESAGQCGPCVHGLDAIADARRRARRRDARRRDVLARLERWSGQVEGRGACHHPDGVGALPAQRARPCSPPSSRTTAATGPATLRRAAGARVPDGRARLAA